MDNKYNGYANYQTWLLATWLMNDERETNYWQERAGQYTNAHLADYDIAKYMCSEVINQLDSQLPPEAGLLRDLVFNVALRDIDWMEVANCFTQSLPSNSRHTPPPWN
jgi:hypothetical protein